MSKWISVKERLPSPFEDVLVYVRNNVETIGFESGEFYHAIDRYVIWNDGFPSCFRNERMYSSTVIHWMPLPEGPEHE